MMKSDKRKKARVAKKARKMQRMNEGGKSPYAQKRNEQRNGHYRPTSPFYTREGA